MTTPADRWEVRKGDVREVLATMPDESVQCVVTSPPYWGLRDYGVEAAFRLLSAAELVLDFQIADDDCIQDREMREAARALRLAMGGAAR